MRIDAPNYSVADYLTRWAEVEAQSIALEGPSLLDRVALIEGAQRGFTEALTEALGPVATTHLAFDAAAWLRPKQLAILRSNSRIILFIAGRRTGKTQTAAEWLIDRLERGAREIVVVGPTYDEVKQFMLGGHKRRLDGVANGSGLLDLLPPWIEYEYLEDEGVVRFEHARLSIHSGELPEYRGPGPDSVWGDEVIKWRYAERLFSNLRIACSSVGKVDPQLLLTTSPKKSLRLLRDLVMDPDVMTLWGRSEENRGNVDERWFKSETRRLGGTSQGAEELEGRLGVEDEGAIFSLSAIDRGRVVEAPTLDRIVVAVDPAVSEHRKSDDTGVVVAGREGDAHDGHGYVLEDATDKHAWDAWGDLVWRLVVRWGASAVVVERDKIGDAGRSNIRVAAARAGYEATQRPGFKHLIDFVHRRTRHRVQLVEVLARGDKASRAEPVANMYTATEAYPTGRVHHVGHHTQLEAEQTEWEPGRSRSPNAMDALVHAMTELFSLDRPASVDGARLMSGFARAQKQLEQPLRRSAERTTVDRDRRAVGERGGYGSRVIR